MKRVRFDARCVVCSGRVAAVLSTHASAATVLRTLTMKHLERFPKCFSGELILPMLSNLRRRKPARAHAANKQNEPCI